MDWEQRMSQRAAARAAAEWQAQRAKADREEAEHRAAVALAQQAEHDAGPPGGCHQCWTWAWGPWQDRYTWGHAYPAVQPGPPSGTVYDSPDPADWCHHGCHTGDDLPYFCGLIAMAAG